MLAALAAILPGVRTTLGTIPLYTQQSRLNREKPAPPYALVQPISQPADPNAFDAVLVFGLDIWAPLWRLSEIASSLEWLDGHDVGIHGAVQNLRYARQGRTMFREPETLMPDGVTELWHLSDSVRCTYAHFPGAPP